MSKVGKLFLIFFLNNANLATHLIVNQKFGCFMNPTKLQVLSNENSFTQHSINGPL